MGGLDGNTVAGGNVERLDVGALQLLPKQPVLEERVYKAEIIFLWIDDLQLDQARDGLFNRAGMCDARLPKKGLRGGGLATYAGQCPEAVHLLGGQLNLYRLIAFDFLGEDLFKGRTQVFFFQLLSMPDGFPDGTAKLLCIPTGMVGQFQDCFSKFNRQVAISCCKLFCEERDEFSRGDRSDFQWQSRLEEWAVVQGEYFHHAVSHAPGEYIGNVLMILDLRPHQGEAFIGIWQVQDILELINEYHRLFPAARLLDLVEKSFD